MSFDEFQTQLPTSKVSIGCIASSWFCVFDFLAGSRGSRFHVTCGSLIFLAISSKSDWEWLGNSFLRVAAVSPRSSLDGRPRIMNYPKVLFCFANLQLPPQNKHSFGTRSPKHGWSQHVVERCWTQHPDLVKICENALKMPLWCRTT